MLYNQLHRNLIIPLTYRVMGSRRLKYLKELLNMEGFTQIEIERVKLKCLKKLLYYAKSSPYYSKIIKEQNFDPHINNLENFSKFPVLTKEIIQKIFCKALINSKMRFRPMKKIIK